MNPMSQLTAQGRQIETDSFAIIDREIELHHGGHLFSDLQWPVVRRAIHTSGDFEFARLFRFSPSAMEAGMEALRRGAPIVSDVTMITAGLSPSRCRPFGVEGHCFISDPEVIERAKASGITRAIESMRLARDKGLLDGGIVAIGNAPTALFEVLRMVEAGEAMPALIIGIPVGFVRADESKTQLVGQAKVPFISSLGRKGGSPLVVSSLHALMVEAAK
ncbi:MULTISPECIES: precorrin-8X methylmutase [Ferrimonas]|uniref:precorrin-8X methylmutase n=1 Tax=Ferrimonas TaxID=44011 RepID=UPI0003FCDA0A|nr:MULTISPECIES: precorrin-8X methylmutase [Ferrimonas]USD39406.1 precorrin-8X methylmutase [Ferrimonas sp. SCSIO 43195]